MVNYCHCLPSGVHRRRCVRFYILIFSKTTGPIRTKLLEAHWMVVYNVYVLFPDWKSTTGKRRPKEA